MLSQDETIKKIKEKVLFTKDGSTLTSTFGDVVLGKSLDITNLENEIQLNFFSHSDLTKVKTYLDEVIKASVVFEKEFGFTANCDYAIDIKYHECLSGSGIALYLENLNYVTMLLDEAFTRGFEHVDVKCRRNEALIDLPQRGTSRSAGYDFKTPVYVILQPNESILIWSDVKAYMLDDEVLKCYMRSSIGNKRIQLTNITAIIDADYYGNPKTDGNIGFKLTNNSDEVFELDRGERFCQGIFQNYLTTDNDSPVSDERGGGYGSTGK